tara:strand:+ start:137 stop:325 length:189 start_codon:yes stop_codon:yes gene_type:complete
MLQRPKAQNYIKNHFQNEESFPKNCGTKIKSPASDKDRHGKEIHIPWLLEQTEAEEIARHWC